ncbi:hypothetical protein RB595_006860 [Gaeumannomyces hyphopodioides]
MADLVAAENIVEEPPANPAADVDMEGGEDGEAAAAAGDETAALPYAGEEGPEETAPARVPFINYLCSPVVTMTAGIDENETILTAHQALLAQSPWFAETCAEFPDDGSPRHIDLTGDDVDAIGCFLEFLYTGDYFPRKVPGTRQLETDPSLPHVDESGAQLLKHARVYTLAEKFQMPGLRNLASSKIHCVNSTAKGEIAYARYVYQHTQNDDTVIRAPVANFWATRSHTLRSEAEEEFRGLCLEFPQFGYDVLTRVLDEKLKREHSSKLHPASGSARKRPRHSQV